MISSALETLTATRVVSGRRRGSSRPIIVETVAGPRLVKLRGAAQGTGALVAEIAVAALADRLGLHVPARSLVVLPLSIPTDDVDDELADLLSSSVGLNLGFEILDHARDFTAADRPRIDAHTRSRILWLDRFVMNLDRTHRNPNLLLSGAAPWLIDHGASLRFQYNWTAVTESTPREVGVSYEHHLFDEVSREAEWAEREAACATLITRDVLEQAFDVVPDDFLTAMSADGDSSADDFLRRRRAAYAAFLWKRLKAPRAFALSPAVLARAGTRGIPPAWVTAPR